MKKAKLIQKIVARLHENLAVLENAARSSRAEATHESSRAESKYDTRGLEAAYLASGQARQAREILEAIQVYEALPVRAFSAEEPIDLSALVELESDGTRLFYFIGPKGGGLEIEDQAREITVITPQSPLGENLMGKTAGYRWKARLGGAGVNYRIVSVV